MSAIVRRSLAAAAIGAALTVAPASIAAAQPAAHGGFGGHTVFVQSDNPAGNQIIVLDEHSDGRLSQRGTVATGGLGGQSQGAAVDELASQDSLVYDASHRLLFAVNAGSDSLSVLSDQGSHLRLVQVLSSGGTFPDSVAVHGDLVYVLDAGGHGTVTGYRILADRLFPLPGSSRSLSLANTTPPNFLTSPGQVGFSPDGSELIVTTKASTSSLDLFGVGLSGLLSAQPTVTPDPGNVPFSFTSTPSGQLAVAEAGNSTLHVYAFGPDSSVTSLSPSVPDGQAALCWITAAGGFYYVANAGSNDISAYSVSSNGTPSLVGTTGVVATTDAGPIDMASSSDGRVLYVEAGGAGAVDEFAVAADGSLTDLGSVAGLGAGIEGIATS
jgi:Lactonase, 7-bladed beta-propeller